MNAPKRSKRAHLPALSPAARTLIRERLNEMPLMQSTRDTVMASLNAAANPAAETSEAVIASLDPADRSAIMQAAQGYAQTLGNVVARGRSSLMMDMELDRLIDSQDEE